MSRSLESEVRIIDKKIKEIEENHQSVSNDELHVAISSILTRLYKTVTQTINAHECKLLKSTIEKVETLRPNIRRAGLERFWQTVKGTFESREIETQKNVLSVYR